MATVEILRAHRPSLTGEAILAALALAMRDGGDEVKETKRYEGRSEWLVIFGVGAAVNNAARNAQIARGGRVLIWDLGYVDRQKVVGHARMSINSDHPQQWLDSTPMDGSRWARLGIEMQERSDPAGPVLLIGLGRKSRVYLNAPEWERKKLRKLARRFPGRKVVFRPKGCDLVAIPVAVDSATPIGELLHGASLVVCRHSNVAVDATIAGVPFEAEDGAAMWLQRREFTPANRLEFLQRLAWWQWRADEAAEAWAFAKRITST